jgi:hypothetical protein
MGVDNFLTSCFFKFNFHATLQSEINAEAAGFSGIGFSRLIPAEKVKPIGQHSHSSGNQESL